MNGDPGAGLGAGRPTALPKQVEVILAQGLLNACNNAYAFEICKLTRIAMDIAARPKLDIGNFVAGPKWFKGFVARHPAFAKRKPTKTNQARLTHLNRITVYEWYAAAGPLFARYAPEELFNMDDTSFDLLEGHQAGGKKEKKR